MFASPLNCSGVCAQYFSNYKEDKIFGANGSAWEEEWKVSGVVNPEFEEEDMWKAVKNAKHK